MVRIPIPGRADFLPGGATPGRRALPRILLTGALLAGFARGADPAPAPTAAGEAGISSAGQAGDSARASDSAAPAPVPSPEIALHGLTSLALSGTVQVKAFYHDFASDRDSDKSLSLQLRRFKLGLQGTLIGHTGFRGEFLLDGANHAFGADDAYLWWRPSPLAGFRGGRFKRPFSQEALQSSSSLYTVERGELYQDFLSKTTGYSSYDLGLAAQGGFEEEGIAIGYEAGIFNGQQSESGYDDQPYQKTDPGFFAKDVAARLTASGFGGFKVEAAVSTKAAENRSNPFDFGYAVNTAYEVGAAYAWRGLRLMGEIAWGDDHQGADSNIVRGSPDFFAFYAMGVWREDYRRGRASELVLKLEGLDPDYAFAKGKGAYNDGKLRYTAGCNYFFTPAVSVLADYSVLQPITGVDSESRLRHSLDVLWRISF